MGQTADLLDELPGRGHDEDLRARLVGYPSLRLSLKVENKYFELNVNINDLRSQNPPNIYS